MHQAAISCVYDESYRAAGSHCEYTWWAESIQALIPNAYAFSSTASDTSTDGATNFAARFGASWDRYIYHACVTGSSADDQAACEHSNAAGNCIYDGGSDMYDIGNVMMTSLMDHAERAFGEAGGYPDARPATGCELGSISYEADFRPVPSTCFGPGGYYEMSEMEGLWIFLTQNFQADEPLTFGVIGNLGHDHSGQAQHFEFASHTWIGFVKATCEADLTDPSVNHMFIVDSGASIQSRPVHTCAGVACQGA